MVGLKGHSHVVMLIVVVNTDDLVDPADESGDLRIDSWYVGTSTAEAPRHQAIQLVESFLFAN